MKLSGQLLLVTAVVAALPLVGVQFVRQLETLLREGHEQALADSARALATMIAAPEPAAAAPEPLYVHPAGRAPFLDGYGDDWDAWLEIVDAFAPAARMQRPAPFPPAGDWPLTVSVADSGQGLFLLFRMRDEDSHFAASAERPGDRIELELVREGRAVRMAIAPAAPGRFTLTGTTTDPVLHGDWQVHARGWNLELRLPARDRPDRLGFKVVDVDSDETTARVIASGGPLPLTGPDRRLDERLQAIVPPGNRAWVVDRHGYVLGRAGSLDATAMAAAGETGFWQALMFQRLTGSLDSAAEPVGPHAARLAGPDLDAARAGGVRPQWRVIRSAEGAGVRVRSAVPLDPGMQGSAMLVVERNADALMLLANTAVLRLLGVSLLAFLATALVLLLFAWRLTRRIRRLERGAMAAVADDGRVAGTLAPMAGGDELAGLSRTVAALLARLRAHQDYLRTLADKLAHELRTPLATIRSSLDNLEAGLARDDPAQRWLARAGHGSRRLERILRAMSEASRLEDALIDEPLQAFDLGALLDQYLRAMRGAQPDGPALDFDKPDEPIQVSGSPDLIAQLLDKLVENALDFTSGDGRIRFSLAREGQRVRLAVDNDGPEIDAARAGQLFEPMVSHRAGRGGRDDRPHLGLGLFVARLIVARHGGAIRARARSGGSRFEVDFPAAMP